MKFHCTFNGREVGAIGIFSNFAIDIDAPSIPKAKVALYDTHEHITQLTITRKNPKNHRLFFVRYFGATNTRPSKVRITDALRGTVIFISYNSEYNNTLEMALDHLDKIGIQCESMGSGGERDDVLMSEDFQTPLTK